MNQLLLAQSRWSIDTWLRQSAPDVHQVGDRCWQVSLKNEAPVSASFDDAFLLFDAPAPVACELEQAPQWLRWNTALAGGAKFALEPSPWRLRLRAEMPIDADANMPARIAEALHGLHDAGQLLEDKHSPTSDFRQAGPASAADDTGHTSHCLLTLLRETGWSFQEREPGVAAMEFALRGESCRMLLEQNSGGFRAGIELLEIDSLAPTSKLALAALLLSASGALRLARPYAADAEEQFTCGFEVRFSGEPTAGELDSALEALAVACWACKEEVRSLLDYSVAESYLAIRNLPPTLTREEF